MRGPVLVSGFGPFLDVVANPSGLVADALSGDPGVHGIVLPVSFVRSAQALDAALRGMPRRPRALLGLGVHRGVTLRVERGARSQLESRSPDVDGMRGATLALAGAALLETVCDVRRLADRLRELDVAPVEISGDAGGYVCERMYRHMLELGESSGVPAVFLHVPPLEVLPLEAQVRAARLLLAELRATA
jgi:pyroglutamyl-peptidase